MLRRTLVAGLLFCLPSVGFAQRGSATPSIEGVWKIAERTDSAAPQLNGTATQPSLMLFTKTHYSVLSVQSLQPRPKVEPIKTAGKPTTGEKLARYEHWNLFVANAGTYEIKGTTLIRHQLVGITESVAGPAAGFTTSELKFEGNNTMWHITKLQPSGERRVKYVRVE